MGLAYLFNKDSCVWPQRQSKTKQNQPLLLGISRENLTATGNGEVTGPRAKGCGRPLFIFSGFQDESQQGSERNDSFRLCPKPYTLRFEKTTLLARG